MSIRARAFRFSPFVLGAVGLSLGLGCSAEPGDSEFASVEDGVIIGANDLISVNLNGSNVPSRYRHLLDGFGRAVYNGALCTATHVGNGIVVSAGHCFGAGSQRVNDVSCSGGYVDFGRRGGSNGSRSSCQRILAMQTGGGLDYAIYRVSPVPSTSVPVQLSPTPSNGLPLTIFSHPGGRPLEWSQTCSVTSTLTNEIRYQCDTQGGSSGASVLRDDTLQIVALHWGGGGNSNIATMLARTPLAEFIGAPPPPPPPPDATPVRVRHSGLCLDVNGGGSANGTNIQTWGCNNSGGQSFVLRDAGGGAYNLVNTNTNKCVDVSGSGTANGTNVQLWDCNGTGAQAFRIENAGGGYGRLVNVSSNKCLDVSGSGTSNGSNVHLWTCHTGSNQQWQVEDPNGCQPRTCSSAGAACGSVSDGCNGTLNCGGCSAGSVCSNNQCVPDGPGCQPTTCSAQGATCGTISDDCNGTLNCGSCASGSTCQNNQCVPTGGGCGGLSGWQQRAYTAGARVAESGRIYECKPYPFSGWCGLGVAYKPPTGFAWQDAWIDRGACQ